LGIQQDVNKRNGVHNTIHMAILDMERNNLRDLKVQCVKKMSIY